MTAPRDHSKAVGGLTFHYVTWGPESAPPLVLLHGLTSHARSWDALGRELSANRRVIALDQRGHGDSDRAPDGDYRVATMAGDVAGFVDALGLERFELLGLSMGGRVGIAYAGGHTARIERLCIVDIGPEIHLPGMERIRQMMAASPERIGSEEEAIEYVRRANPRAPEAGLPERVRHGMRPLPDGGLEWKYDKALRDMMRQSGRREAIDLWEPLRRITAPTLLVRGADSDVLSADVAERMIDALPDGR
ncbi:MAG: alpha/beta fold hydrolase, partial [Candidatus Rokubacteria bacterium]|nr:alpha/beta fold hydrolase [Candidatus Rokubacteria bacterium]